MSKRRASGVPLVVFKFSEEAVRLLRRLGFEVTEFFAPIVQLLQSVFSYMAGMYETVLSAVSLSEISLTRISILPPADATRLGQQRKRFEAQPRRISGVAAVLPILFNITPASRMARDLSVRVATNIPVMAVQEAQSPSQKLTAAYAATNIPVMAVQEESAQEEIQISSSGLQQPEPAFPTVYPAYGKTAPQQPQTLSGRRAEAPEYKVKAVTQALHPRAPIAVIMAAASPFASTWLSGRAVSAITAATSLQGMVLEAQRSTGAAPEADLGSKKNSAGALLAVGASPPPMGHAANPKAMYAQEGVTSPPPLEASAHDGMPQKQQFSSSVAQALGQHSGGLEAAPAGMPKAKTGVIQSGDTIAHTARRGMPFTMVSNLTKRAAEIVLASGLIGAASVQNSTTGSYVGVLPSTAPIIKTAVSGGTAGIRAFQPHTGHISTAPGRLPVLPVYMVPNSLQMISLALRASAAPSRRLSEEGRMVRRAQSRAEVTTEGIVLSTVKPQMEISPESGIFRIISDLLTEYPSISMMRMSQTSFGSVLEGSWMPPLGASVAERTERELAQSSEEFALMSMPRSMRLDEPKVSANPTAVNINVVAEDEGDLRELERKISKMLEGQMRRYYGQG